MATAASETQVQKLYIAYFGRAADPTGLAFFADALATGATTVDDIATGFATSAEAAPIVALSTDDFISAVYQQAFGRAYDSATDGTFWTDAINAGTTTKELAMVQILDGATGADISAVNNKVTVAIAFTTAVVADDKTYVGHTAAAAAKLVLDGVTADAATVATGSAAAQATVDGFEDADSGGGGGIEGTTFSLTSSTDRGDDFVGTDNNDQYNAYLAQNAFAGGVSNTLSSADVLDGGDGTDSLYAELVPEFFGATGDNQIDVQPRTTNIENVSFEARDSGSNDVNSNTDVSVDAKNMLDVNKIGSSFSDGDLIIENLTTKQSNGEDRNTEEITITMDHTDNFNSDNDASDLTVYFDEDYLLAGQSVTASQANYWILDENSDDIIIEPLENIEKNGVLLEIDGTSFEIKMADDVALTKLTWDSFAAGLQDVITASGEAAFVGLSVTVDTNNTDSTFNDFGIEVTIPAITITDSQGRSLVPTGFTSPELVTGNFDIFGRFDNVASTDVDDLVSVNIELDKAGREGEGGDLVIGGKDTTSVEGNGIPIFNIDVLGDAARLSNVGGINSTNNALTTVNIATDSAFVSGDTHASLTIRDAFDNSNAMETVNANSFLGDLNIGSGTAALNVDTFTATGGGDVTYNAEINGIEKDVFTNTTGSGDDAITVSLAGDAVDTVGTSFAVNAGGGTNTVTVTMDSINDAGVSAATMALLDNLNIASGSGADTIVNQGYGDFNITSGGGSDMVHIRSLGDSSSNFAAKGIWETGDILGSGPTTFVDRVLYQAELTVNFAGFEETVTVVTKSAGNFVATQLDINNAIKAAVAANVELSKLLTITDRTGSQQLIIASTVEGDNDLTIDLFQGDLVASGATGTQVNFNSSDLTAVQAGLMATTANNSDATDTVAEIIAILNPLAGNLDETGAPGVVYDLLGTADLGAVDGVDETAVTNVSTIDMGTGANDLLVLNSHDDSANVLDFSAAWGKVSVVNFFTDQAGDPLTPLVGFHKIDFTAFLDDQIDPSATPDTLSAVRWATTVANDSATGVTLASNTVAIVNDFAEAGTETWSGLTAGELQTALNGTLAADDFANFSTDINAADPGNLIGTTIDSIIMVQNDLNAGEYKVFNAETDALDAVVVTFVGTIDFGATIDATAVFV